MSRARTILIVTQNDRLRFGLADALMPVGEIRCACDYDTAQSMLGTLRRHQPDLIVTRIEGSPLDSRERMPFHEWDRWLAGNYGGAVIYLRRSGQERRPLRHPVSAELRLPAPGELLRTAARELLRIPMAYGDTTFDPRTFNLRCRGRTVRLTPTEANLVTYLIEHAPRPILWSELLRNVWNDCEPEMTGQSLVSTHLANIRLKAADAGMPNPIATRLGCGYQWTGALPHGDVRLRFEAVSA